MPRKAPSKTTAVAKTRVADAKPKVVKVMPTADGLKNILSGMGGNGDKLANTMFVAAAMDRTQLDAAYRGDWIARKGVDIPAFDSTREWRSWQADPKQITAIEAVEKQFRIQQKTMRTIQRSRLYGGGIMVLGVDDGKRQDEPLEVEKIEKGALKFVHSVSRFDMTAGALETDIESPYYGEPQYYTQNGTSTGQVQFHPSRIVRFGGQPILDPNNAVDGWGDSILVAVSEAIMGTGMVTNSVAQLVSEAKVDVIKMPGLSANIETEEYEANLKKRFEVASYAKSVYRILLMDKDEEWERIQANFAGLNEIQQLFLLIVSGAFDIPATRFLGQSPAGLSATGDSDIRNYYDRCSTTQKMEIQPTLSTLDNVIIRSALGPMSQDDADKIFYNWNPLWQFTASEKADIDLKRAQTYQIDVNTGLLNQVVLKKARENQIIEFGTYPGFEMILDEFDDNPDEVDPTPAPPVDPNAPKPDPNAEVDPNADPNAKPDPKADPVPPKKADKAEDRRRIADMAARVRSFRTDATSTPRSLYVRRDVLNVKDIVAWAKAQGFDSIVEDLHVTVIYSKTAVDWLKVGSDDWGSDPDGGLTIKPGGPRVIEQFGEGAVVLAFSNSQLQYRHMSAMDAGASYDYDDYTPHITITYSLPAGMDLNAIQPYRGEIKFGPEIFEEIKGPFDPANSEVEV